MSSGKTWWASLREHMVFVCAALAIALAACEVLADMVTWVELDVAAIYGLPLVLAVAARKRLLLWTLTALLMIATFAVYWVQIPSGDFAWNEIFFVNRVLDAVAILVTAGLLHIWMTSLDTVDAQGRLLKDQNDRLEDANVALIRNQEQIAAQNDRLETANLALISNQEQIAAQNEKLEAANLALVHSQEQIAAQNRELERRRTDAEQASARKTRLLASASHDIRTPVHTINLLAEVIRRTAEDPILARQVPSMALRLQANAASLNNLISDVLDIARFDSGHVDCHISTFSLNELIASKRGELLPLAEAKTLRLEAEMPEAAMWLRTDRIMLDRVLANLITNAIKFTAVGSVTVSAAMAPDRAAIICVRDTGPGIASEQLPQVFDEFAQLHNPAGDRSKGWGLGLAICRRLVGFMEGTITVESELNKGTLFTVRLPPECVADIPESPTPLTALLESHA